MYIVNVVVDADELLFLLTVAVIDYVDCSCCCIFLLTVAVIVFLLTVAVVVFVDCSCCCFC